MAHTRDRHGDLTNPVEPMTVSASTITLPPIKGVIPAVLGDDGCTCAACFKERHKGAERGDPFFFARMHLCETCGNKRCPHATDHRHACTNSNEPGQPGSAYE